MKPLTQRVWMWIVTHREWVFSGIGTAIVMAALGYLLAQSGDSQDQQAADRDSTTITHIEQQTTGSGSPAIAGVKGNVTIHQPPKESSK